MSIKITCDNKIEHGFMSQEINDNEEIYCQYCYQILLEQIENLKSENKELKLKVEELYETIEDSKARSFD
jgi:hypothetical protein